jgi:hypothetical protein
MGRGARTLFAVVGTLSQQSAAAKDPMLGPLGGRVKGTLQGGGTARVQKARAKAMERAKARGKEKEKGKARVLGGGLLSKML